jgi:acyl-[acyl carrier protein]--UDP-N-acetylglucosamine O-acyltransferase
VMLEGARLEAEAQAVDAVIGPQAALEQGVAASDHTIIGAAATVAAGSRLSGARVPVRVPTQ